MKKKKILVLFGGCSSEYGVSLKSAYSVISYMDREKYEPVMVGISKEGRWFYYDGPVEKIANDSWRNLSDCTPAMLSPDRGARSLLLLTHRKVKNIHVDAVFPVLHGKNGEDGTVQGLVELAGLPLVGCGSLASALCMDKDRAHRLVRETGIAVPRACVLEKEIDLVEQMMRIQELGYPLFVKPIKAGSSCGITRVQQQSELASAVALAFRYDDQVLVEENIEGFEVGCAVMGNGSLTVGAVDEIELADGFFDFTEKYTLKTSKVHVPARITEEVSDRIKEAAAKIYRTLNCRGFARVDLFLTPYGEIIFNEVNTIPGFTPHSRFPSMMRAAGVPCEEVISRAIELAVES